MAASAADLPEPESGIARSIHRRMSSYRTATLEDLVGAWSLHINRIANEMKEPPSEDESWWSQDLVAALFMRDFVEECLAQAPNWALPILQAWIGEVDARFRAITEDDHDNLLELAADEPLTEKGWWWRRIPTSGPIREDLESL